MPRLDPNYEAHMARLKSEGRIHNAKEIAAAKERMQKILLGLTNAVRRMFGKEPLAIKKPARPLNKPQIHAQVAIRAAELDKKPD
jgi:hypothetical protein